jgi:hypothetical protein
MSRERLPNRRRAVTETIRWPALAGRPVDISAGFTLDGRLLEVFIKIAGQSGTELGFLSEDGAVLISRLLQFGDRLEDIAAGLGRTSSGERTSLLGAAVDRLLDLKRK